MAGRATTSKVQPAAYAALIEALATICWYKRDLVRFIRVWARDSPALIVGLDFDGYKRSFAEEFVDRLQADEARYQDLTLSIMLEVAQMEDFPGLARHENSTQLVAQAKTAVATLKSLTEKHQKLLDEKDRFAAELVESRARVEAQQGFTAKLAELRTQFNELAAMADRQKAGKLFESFLSRLFQLFDLEPRLAYELASEQIDGSLTFDTDDYIIEAKWWKAPMEREHFDAFDAKVRRKGKNALGLFVAVNGFTAGALREYNQRTTFLTMDGGDLICVLEGRVSLDELLRRKKRHANETGDCFYPAYMALAQ